MKVLLAINDSIHREYLASFMQKSIRSEGTQILVMSVVQQMYPAAPEMDGRYAPELEEERSRAQRRIDQMAAQLKESGFSVLTVVHIGDARECILNLCAQWGADRVFIGSRGHGTIRHFIFGSVAEFVARHARCSHAIIWRTGTA